MGPRAENLDPPGLDPRTSQSLYRLSYPAHIIYAYSIIIIIINLKINFPVHTMKAYWESGGRILPHS